jgi:glycosyltransferase involved in cell wall biosynthesis
MTDRTTVHMQKSLPDVLRIAFATQEYITEQSFDGGIANYISRTARALAAKGHDVHVITLSTIDQTEFEHEGVMVHRVPFGKIWLQLNRLTRYRLTATMHLLGTSTEVYRKLKQLHSDKPFDLIQAPNCSCCGLVSMLLLRVPCVLRASWYEPVWHEADKLTPTLDSRLIAKLERLQLKISRNTYAPSLTLKNILSEQAGVANVEVIPSMFLEDCDERDYSIYDQKINGKKYLLFFGRFELRKGFHILVQALPVFFRRHPDASVVMVGRDKQSAIAPSMADYARTVCGNQAARLIILGQLPHRQLYPIIEGAHLVALPSLIDNMPNACLEAMALGKAVVGTREGSFAELIDDGKTGFLVEANNVDALAQKLTNAWISPNLRAIGMAARRRIDDFRPENCTPALLHYYRQILQS